MSSQTSAFLASTQSSQILGNLNLPMLLRGQGQAVDGQVVDFPAGCVLWCEWTSKPMRLEGPIRIRLVVIDAIPFLDIFRIRPLVLEKEMRVPLVDVLGLAAIDEELEAFREELARERNRRSVH